MNGDHMKEMYNTCSDQEKEFSYNLPFTFNKKMECQPFSISNLQKEMLTSLDGSRATRIFHRNMISEASKNM